MQLIHSNHAVLKEKNVNGRWAVVDSIVTYAGIGGFKVPFWYWAAGEANGSNPWNILDDDCDDDDDGAEDWARLYKIIHIRTTSNKKIISAKKVKDVRFKAHK